MMSTSIKLALLGTVLSTALIAGSANAASKCKGLEISACNANASCGWVNGYERKDGRKVSSFCRAKSGAAKKTKAKGTASSKIKLDEQPSSAFVVNNGG